MVFIIVILVIHHVLRAAVPPQKIVHPALKTISFDLMDPATILVICMNTKTIMFTAVVAARILSATLAMVLETLLVHHAKIRMFCGYLGPATTHVMTITCS